MNASEYKNKRREILKKHYDAMDAHKAAGSLSDEELERKYMIYELKVLDEEYKESNKK